MGKRGEDRGKSNLCFVKGRRLVQADDAKKRAQNGKKRDVCRAARGARRGGDHRHRRGGLRADSELVERQRPRHHGRQSGGEVRVHPRGRDDRHARGGERRRHARRVCRAAVYGAGDRLLCVDDGAKPEADRLSRRSGHGAGRGRPVRDDSDGAEDGLRDIKGAVSSLDSSLELLPHGLAEIIPRFPVARFAADGVDDVPAEKQEDVEQTEHDRHPRGRAADDEIIQIQRRVGQREILHLDRQEHEQQHLLVGIQRGVGEEQRQIEEHVTAIAGNQRGDDRAEHADPIIQVEPDLAPLVFQPETDHVVEIQREQNENRRAGRRREHERHQPPDLPAHEPRAGQRDERIKPVAQRRPDIHQREDDALTDDDVFHQIADGIAAQFALQVIIDAVVLQAADLLLM